MSLETLDQGMLILTDATCRLRSIVRQGIPTLVWPDGIDEDASDWFRYLALDLQTAPGSVREYAKILRPFLRFCRERKRHWKSVDDAFLTIWREHQRNVLQVGASRINTCLQVIFSFYKWSEETRRIRFHVGIYNRSELPEILQDVRFPISAKQQFGKGRKGKIFGVWTTPLTLRTTGKSSRMRHTPTEEEIRDIHEHVVEREMGERNSLMFSWQEEAGPRRFEINSLKKSQMPTLDQLSELIDNDEAWVIDITRKGQKVGEIRALPDLLIRTIDHIENGRRAIVDKHRGTIGYREPDEVFLSSRTGMPMHLDSVTSMGRDAFRAAGISNSSPHRLRARFAVNTIEALLDAVFGDDLKIGSASNWVETILVKAAEQMGHGSPESLRPYLTYVLNRRIQTADATKATKLESRLRQLRLHEGTLVKRISEHQELHEIARLLKDGKRAEARDAIDRLSAALADETQATQM